jgi:hypothetical protein
MNAVVFHQFLRRSAGIRSNRAVFWLRSPDRDDTLSFEITPTLTCLAFTGSGSHHGCRTPLKGAIMEQRFETTPRAEIRLQGRRVTRGDITGDWGLRVQWEVRRNGQVIATPPARADLSYEHPDMTPGTYEIVLQMWRYIDYRKNASGEYVNSRFVNISNKVSYTI